MNERKKVFVAGAGGTIGMPVVRRLLERGDEVVGLSRTAEGAGRLRAAGAEGVIGDALDGERLARLVRDVRPTHVLHLLTAIPKAGANRPEDLEATNILRTRGTANLLQAAIAAGAGRVVAESFVLAYGTGDRGRTPLGESPLPPFAHRNSKVQAIVDAIRSLEEQMALAAPAVETVVLRYGFLYGPGVPSTAAMAEALRRRKLPVIRGARGLASFVHIDDAAAATVAALDRGASGSVINVADDEPVPLMDFVRLSAEAAGAPRPFAVPQWLAKFAAPFALELATSSVPMSNARARRELAWTPAHRSVRDGLAARPQPVRVRHARDGMPVRENAGT